MFTAKEIFPGVYHAADVMGVFITLIVGKERALLVDTGWGLQNVKAWVESVTKLPITVLLTHAHHDHSLGAMYFDEVLLFAEDDAWYDTYTSVERRQRVAKSAEENGIQVPQNFMTAQFPKPVHAKEEMIDLGGLHARIILQPGHTPGSCMVMVEEYSLLLTGDDWNPCTWLFFPEAIPVHAYLDGMKKFVSENKFDHVICPHREGLYPGDMVRRFLQELTDEKLKTAYPVDLWQDGGNIEPVHCDADDEQYLVFDRQKMWS